MANYMIRLAIMVLATFFLHSEVVESQQHRYDREYPQIGYSSKTPTDRVQKLGQLLATQKDILQFENENASVTNSLAGTVATSHPQEIAILLQFPLFLKNPEKDITFSTPVISVVGTTWE